MTKRDLDAYIAGRIEALRRLGPDDVRAKTKVHVYLNHTTTPWVSGEVIGFSDGPMALIRTVDGRQLWVNCSLRWEPQPPEAKK